ncbi:MULTISPECIES: helix-turn-helix transcriptional regulator [unclassified Streptomyces]|uniref:helix-turn-helix transcriptional regulator n=1 Tax=unclassified Streptomyces TaxID=2593676 RepID=UPI002E35DCD2|nr:helix-turn-helix transcriptional regulator [Streptomyces sp. NBC_01268]
MPQKLTEPTHPHGHVDLCAAGTDLYASALRIGRITRSEAEAAPCLMDLDLLHPDPDDPSWLRPVPPSAALARLVQPLEREIQDRRALAMGLSSTFEPFMAISAQDPSTTHAITVLEGLHRIDAVLGRATAECSQELLTVQPGGGRSEHTLNTALNRIQPLLDRGVRVRTLYQHTARHSPGMQVYLEQAGMDRLQVRTLEESIERLIIIDRSVALIPARQDRQVALELRHPGLVEYLATVFEQSWARATPFGEQVPNAQRRDGISGVQHSIAKLLVEGHVDEAIARRLGMNVRTCRAHIAKLAATLGSGSRAQLGFLIAQSGILDEPDPGPEQND